MSDLVDWLRGVLDEDEADGSYSVRADVAAKREIIDVCVEYMWESEHGPDPCARGVLRALASAYRDRPGWRDEWEV